MHEKHPKTVLGRAKKLAEDLDLSWWQDVRPLRVTARASREPVSLEEAMKLKPEPAGSGYAWGPVWSTCWFRVQGEVPRSWKNRQVALLMDTGSEALLWEDGKPSHGLDVNHRDVFLSKSSTASGKVDLWVEAAGNELFGAVNLPDKGKARSPSGSSAPTWRYSTR